MYVVFLYFLYTVYSFVSWQKACPGPYSWRTWSGAVAVRGKLACLVIILKYSTNGKDSQSCSVLRR